MSKIAHILSQQTCLKQFKNLPKTEIDIRGWVANQNYSIDHEITPSSFKLRLYDDIFFAALANDCDRMAKAAFETICNIQNHPTFPQSTSWHLIQSYYAAFFSAHALLKIFGISYSQFQSEHLSKVLEQAKLYQKDNGIRNIEHGFYKLQYIESEKQIAFTKMKDSHKGTWSCFHLLIQDLIQNIDKTTGLVKDKLKTVELLSEIKSGLTQHPAGSSGNWLSIIRNDVNYKQSHGLWFPFKGQNLGQYNRGRCNSAWLDDSIGTGTLLGHKKIESALILSTLIINLMKRLLSECNQRFSNQSKIFKNGSLKMMNIIGEI
jgi:hypothetical protein